MVENKSVNKHLSPEAMEQDRRLQLIDLAIQKHIHDKKSNNNNNQHNLKDHETEYQLVLSQLLSASELELSKRDETVNQYDESNSSELVAAVNEEKESEDLDDGGSKGSENNDEIIKEVKKVKKQNFVTHCLLSAMIVLTVAWQLSEVSLVWKVKQGINHPFRSFGNMVKDTVKDVKEKVYDFNGKDAADDKEKNESTSSLTTSIKIPDITNMDVPNKGME